LLHTKVTTKPINADHSGHYSFSPNTYFGILGVCDQNFEFYVLHNITESLCSLSLNEPSSQYTNLTTNLNKNISRLNVWKYSKMQNGRCNCI